MTKLEILKRQIDEKLDKSFTLDKCVDRYMDQISELCFMGEIDHEIFYMQQLEQVLLLPDYTIYNPTIGQLNEFYLTGNIKDIVFRPLWSIHWFVNMEKKYVKCFAGHEMDLTKSPKDNYGKIYNKLTPKDAGANPNHMFVKEFEIKDSEHEQIWNDLIAAVKWSCTNNIEFGDFDKKVQQNLSQHWGRYQKDGFVDDEYLQTLRAEVIKLPVKHSKVNINKDLKVKRLINGMSFKVKDWNDENNTITRDFETFKECSDYFYSLIEYVDKTAPERKDSTKQKTKVLVKRYFSNKWPSIEPTGDAEADELAAKEQSKKLTKFKVYITKYNETVYFKMEVWERGIVFEICNEDNVGNV